MENIYIVETGNSPIVKVTAAGATSTLSLSGLSNPSTVGFLLFGVTTDPSGNLYIPIGLTTVLCSRTFRDRILPASTNVGSTSSDSPKAATVTNIGNQPLVFFAVPAFTTDL
jgi:hypothetical protein